MNLKEEKQPTLQFIKSKFSEYYKNTALYLPDRFGRREFAFFYFETETMQRPVAFKTKDEVVSFLIERIPAHVYYSAAYYEDPSVPMAQKKWLGADLIFDLDADHVSGTEKLNYEEMLAKVKSELIKLIDNFLLDDLGFEPKNIQIVFSGGRGYHIHIREPQILQLDSHERRELVDYITSTDLDGDWLFPESIVRTERKRGERIIRIRKLPLGTSFGWKRKIRKGWEKLALELDKLGKEDAIRTLSKAEGVGEVAAKGIYQDLFVGEKGNRGIDRMLEEGNIEVFSKDKYRDAFLKIVKEEVKVNMKGETDEPVTSDVKRLIRLPTTLHGKSGLMVVPLSREQLNNFIPTRDAIPQTYTSEPIKVNCLKPLTIKLKFESFSLKEGENEVPEYAGIFFLCRGNAVLSS